MSEAPLCGVPGFLMSEEPLYPDTIPFQGASSESLRQLANTPLTARLQNYEAAVFGESGPCVSEFGSYERGTSVLQIL